MENCDPGDIGFLLRIYLLLVLFYWRQEKVLTWLLTYSTIDIEPLLLCGSTVTLFRIDEIVTNC